MPQQLPFYLSHQCDDRNHEDHFGNPSSLHAHGRMASKLLRESREQIAQSLHTLPNRIFFTSDGSESNNTVIKGYCLKHQADGKHIITTALEHHAVLEPIEYLVERFRI